MFLSQKILTHSYSRVVLRVLEKAAAEKKRFSVYVTESQPDSAGWVNTVSKLCPCLILSLNQTFFFFFNPFCIQATDGRSPEKTQCSSNCSPGCGCGVNVYYLRLKKKKKEGVTHCQCELVYSVCFCHFSQVCLGESWPGYCWCRGSCWERRNHQQGVFRWIVRGHKGYRKAGYQLAQISNPAEGVHVREIS